MSDLTRLRLYFPLSTKVSGFRFWHRQSAPNLAHHLLSYARRAGIKPLIRTEILPPAVAFKIL